MRDGTAPPLARSLLYYLDRADGPAAAARKQLPDSEVSTTPTRFSRFLEFSDEAFRVAVLLRLGAPLPTLVAHGIAGPGQGDTCPLYTSGTAKSTAARLRGPGADAAAPDSDSDSDNDNFDDDTPFRPAARRRRSARGRKGRGAVTSGQEAGEQDALTPISSSSPPPAAPRRSGPHRSCGKPLNFHAGTTGASSAACA